MDELTTTGSTSVAELKNGKIRVFEITPADAGLQPARLEQLHTFGAPGRDPRGWTVSVAYLAVLEEGAAQSIHPRAGDDAAGADDGDLAGRAGRDDR